jgi:divalent metal cation (Fe/Co/Zn/Cd) transporter
VILFASSYVNVGGCCECVNSLLGPSTRFPFGIEKLKNMVVLVPGGLFVFFGVEISMEAVTKFIHYSHLEHDMDVSPVSLAVRGVVVGCETSCTWWA